MMYFKDHNKKGFSFIEIVMAVAIIGILLTSLFALQNNIFNIAINQHSKILRIFDIRNIFFDHESIQKLKTEKSLKKEFQDPSMKLSAQIQKPDKKSSLSKFENIYIFKSTGKWRTLAKENEETMVSLFFKKDKDKKEK